MEDSNDYIVEAVGYQGEWEQRSCIEEGEKRDEDLEMLNFA